MKHYRIKIRGKVQGVWYRASARRAARELGLAGIVRNEPDGSVYAEAEGEEAALKDFVDWCRKGPDMAQVEAVLVEEGPLKGYEGFDIQH